MGKPRESLHGSFKASIKLSAAFLSFADFSGMSRILSNLHPILTPLDRVLGRSKNAAFAVIPGQEDHSNGRCRPCIFNQSQTGCPMPGVNDFCGVFPGTGQMAWSLDIGLLDIENEQDSGLHDSAKESVVNMSLHEILYR